MPLSVVRLMPKKSFDLGLIMRLIQTRISLVKVVVHCTSNRVSAPLITSPSPMTGSGGIFAQTAAVLERNVLTRSLLLCVVVGWISVWGCGKVGVRCGKLCLTGEGVKINRKIISKKFGGVECLFYFCGVQISERPINGLQILLVYGRGRAPHWRSLNFYISGTCTPVR